jgi:Zn-dependent peptidase ImmA (M78 family)
MPEEQVIKTFEKNKNVLELANTFRVSMQTAMYRLKECGILLSG